MDYEAAILRVYEHLDKDHVDKAVMTCLRIARNLQDFLYSAVFLREMYPNKRECRRIFLEDTRHLKNEARKYVWEHSVEYWLETHTLAFSFGKDENGDEKNVLAVGISEIDSELEQWERSIADLHVPAGMNSYDTAAITNNYMRQKAEIRLRMKALQTVKQRIKAHCLNYAIRIERQLQAQGKSQSFLAQVHTEVNNYFKAHSENVYTKLQKAAQLVDSDDSEDCSLLLTEVRRAMKASADFFYPPTNKNVMCADGRERVLDEEQYLNRLHEFLATKFAKSSSRDLLRSELEHLAVFARRLNDVASKGVHGEVNPDEGKQGLLGLYMFLFNLTSRLQRESF
jgi:predicted DNA binding CopG/RHH family protein